MKIGDLVRCPPSSASKPGTSLPRQDEQLGIITELWPRNAHDEECFVVWFTCDRKGWWKQRSLEVVSENR
jgi:hypothetical protein